MGSTRGPANDTITIARLTTPQKVCQGRVRAKANTLLEILEKTVPGALEASVDSIQSEALHPHPNPLPRGRGGYAIVSEASVLCQLMSMRLCESDSRIDPAIQ